MIIIKRAELGLERLPPPLLQSPRGNGKN